MGRQCAPGAVTDAEHASALDGGDEPHVGAGQDHEVDGFLHSVDQRLHGHDAELA